LPLLDFYLFTEQSQGGVDVTVKDVDVYPTTVWGKIKKSIVGIADVSARGAVNVDEPETVDLDVRINAFGTAFQLVGHAGTYCYFLLYTNSL
jgi:hypothetical protein